MTEQRPGDRSAPEASTLTCFVIGPIGSQLAGLGTPEREIYEESLRVMAEVIEPACVAQGLNPVRADTLARAGEITEQIFWRLREDDVVIADLTDANPNVMYELGLRHTRDKLTVQIGEYGRLPFDVNTIRTIQFSRSAIGLINARDQLINVLAAGIAGDFDPVTATRVWGETDRGGVGDAVAAALSEHDQDGLGDDERGFLDIMVEAEEQQEKLAPAVDEIGECIGELGRLSEQSADQLTRSDAAGKGMKGRMQVAAAYARGLSEIADRLEQKVENYVTPMEAFSAGTLALIEQMENDAEALEQGREFGMLTRRTAAISRESMASLGGMVDAIRANTRISRVLREPSERLTRSLDRMAAATGLIDEWDRRLQALGIPTPPEDWEPATDEPDADEGSSPHDVADAGDGASEPTPDEHEADTADDEETNGNPDE